MIMNYEFLRLWKEAQPLSKYYPSTYLDKKTKPGQPTSGRAPNPRTTE
jgi:hypothetical protein